MQQANPMSPQNANNQTGSTKLVLFSLLLGLVTAALINVYLGQVRKVVDRETVLVYQNKVAIDKDEQFAINQYNAIAIPEQFEENLIAAGFIVGKDAFNRLALEQETYQVGVTMGELLNKRFFIPPELSSLGNAPRPGFRRIPLRVNPKNLPAGIKPAHYVDVLAPFPDPKNRKPKSMLVLEDIQILGIGSQTTYDESGSSKSIPTITIDIRKDVAVILSDLERMISPTDGNRVFELHWRQTLGDNFKLDRPQIAKPGEISDPVIKLYEAYYGVKVKSFSDTPRATIFKNN